jgi:L-ascorbate metabolism protein UlaG (beta-lactamase superfamily)
MQAGENPAALTAEWFGVTTLLIRDSEHAILIDGFFSRPRLSEVLSEFVAPDETRIAMALGDARIDAIFVSHSHYDHALDAPYVAQKKQAMLFGSESTLNIAHASGLARDRLCMITHGDRIRLGKFEIQVYRTPHPPTPFGGAIDDSFEVPARAADYRLGASFSFLLRHPAGHVLVVPSASSRPGMLEGASADVVFLGIGSLGIRSEADILAYWREAVGKPKARLVIPVHWDNFMLPFTAPLPPLPFPFDDVERTLGILERQAPPGVDFKLMPLAAPVWLPVTAHPAPAGASPTRATCPG